MVNNNVDWFGIIERLEREIEILDATQLECSFASHCVDKAFKEEIATIRAAGHEVSDLAESGRQAAVMKLNELMRMTVDFYSDYSNLALSNLPQRE